MKRLVIIAAACLVPFVALVWWGLSASAPAPVELPAPAPVVVAQAPAASPDAVRAAPAAPPAVPLPPAPQREDAVAPPPATLPLETNEKIIKVVVAQLTPVVNNCFLEMNERLRRKVRLATMFEANPDGTLTNVKVKMKAADPYLVACVQDAIEGAHLDPARGLPAAAMRHTFAFPPEKGE